MNFAVPLLFVAAMAATPLPAVAQTTSFRCKNELVSVGEGKAAALLKCGEPVVKDSFCKPVQPSTVLVTPPSASATAGSSSATVIVVAVCETVDEWTYNPGYGQFMTTLRFESAKLVSITYGDRVK